LQRKGIERSLQLAPSSADKRQSLSDVDGRIRDHWHSRLIRAILTDEYLTRQDQLLRGGPAFGQSARDQHNV
jgi:hypothetical protein